jgi:hypothetical protein
VLVQYYQPQLEAQSNDQKVVMDDITIGYNHFVLIGMETGHRIPARKEKKKSLNRNKTDMRMK